MGTLLMADNKKAAGGPAAGDKISTIKVKRSRQQTVMKIAALRGLSQEELFDQPDVIDFFNHLLLAELHREQERVQPAKKGR